jgi:aspartate aminotransferase
MSAGRTILDLTVGEPDLDTPDHVKQAAISAIWEGETKYTPVNGTVAMREAIAYHTERRTGTRPGHERICVGGGAKQVIFLALMASVEEGHEVVVPAPYWVSYPDMVAAHGATPVLVECTADDRFLLTPDALESAITPATRWVVLNTPANPTGAVYSAEELAKLADVLRRHVHVRVLCDEIYDEIVFDGERVPALADIAPDLAERVFAVNGVSKAYAMTGWRLGWGVGDPGLVSAVNTLQSQSSSCPSSVSQAAAVAAMTGDQSFIRESVASYRARRDLIHQLLDDVDGLEPTLPDGSFYLWVGCADLVGRTTPDGTVLASDQDVVLYLLENAGVATIQGSAYGSSPYFRISFATSNSVLKDAAGQISAAVGALT